MKILAFLLATLKVLGILLLCAILILSVILAIVLLVPIKYSIKAEKSTRLYANLEITWFKKIIYFRYKISNRCKKVVFKVFRKYIIKNREVFGNDVENDSKIDSNDEYFPDTSLSDIDIDHYDTESEIQTSKIKPDIESSSNHKTQKEKQIDLKLENIVEDESEKLEEEIEQDIEEHSIIDKLKIAWNYDDRKQIVELSIKLIKRILKIIFPQNLKVDIEFGSDNPATTGYVLAMSSILTLYFGNTVKITGNFDRPVLNGKLDIDGKFNLGKIVFAILRYMAKRPIRKLIFKYLKNRKKGNDNNGNRFE